MVMVGIRENEERTRFLGFNTQLVIRRVYIISGIYGGVAGALMAAFNSFASPTFYHPAVSGEIIIMSLLGGMGTLIGPIIGFRHGYYSWRHSSSWLADSWMMVLGGIFAAFILFSPGGVMGLTRKSARG